MIFDYILGAIAMMHVPIENRYFLHSFVFQSIISGNSSIRKQTETHAIIRVA